MVSKRKCDYVEHEEGSFTSQLSLSVKQRHEEDREHPDSGKVGRKLTYVSATDFLGDLV